MLELAERQQKLEERMIELEKRMLELAERQQKLEERMIEVEEELIHVRRLSELNRRDVSAITEALYSRWVLETIEKEASVRGESILGIYRNYLVKDREIDLVVETDKSIYCVEVKIQPNHHDVDELWSKAQILRDTFMKQVIPIIAATWVGRETSEYAKSKNVRVIAY
jgi:vacuolar-type H+-ATPase subunit I/STV1